jgi:hypothetical protein
MIGRAAATNPWIFSQMQQYAETGRYDTPSEAARHRLLIDYYRQINAASLPDGLGKMKQFACWFTYGVGNGSELRRIVHAARTPSEVLESVESFFLGRAASRAAGSEGNRDHGPSADSQPVAPDSSGVAVNENCSAVTQEIDRLADARKEDPAHGPAHERCVEATLRT